MKKTRRQEPRVREALAAIMEEYKPRSAQEAETVLRELFAGTLEDMLKAELDEHLGYKRHSQEAKATGNRRNGTSGKSVRTSMGEMELAIPRDRDGEFEPAAIPKNKRDVSEIEEKVIKMYGRGTSDRDISATIEDIYGFKLSHETISDITEAVLPRVREWRERPLQAAYPFIFIDALYADVKEERASKKKAVYAIVGIDADGHKDVPGFRIRETEGAKEWLNIFDGLKARGVKRVSFVSADGLKGVEEAARTAFGDGMTFQRCIVHLWNSLKYVPSKHCKEFCADLKAVYSAPDAEAARLAFGDLEEKWGAGYPGAVRVWRDNYAHVEQLFDYPAAIRKMIYTTNIIESVNSALRKVTFPERRPAGRRRPFQAALPPHRRLDAQVDNARRQLAGPARSARHSQARLGRALIWGAPYIAKPLPRALAQFIRLTFTQSS